MGKSHQHKEMEILFCSQHKADISSSFKISIRRHNFGISFLSRDRNGTEMYLSLASDWDLDLAFLSAAKPYLQLKMDIKSSEESKIISLLNSLLPKSGGEILISGDSRELDESLILNTKDRNKINQDKEIFKIRHRNT